MLKSWLEKIYANVNYIKMFCFCIQIDLLISIFILMVDNISKKFILNLLRKSNILDLIKNKIFLKKCGKNYFSICPFHSEKNPSFTVNEEKQYYHCFGCGAHGNVIDFLMHYNKLNFVQAVRELSNFYKVDFPAKGKVIFNSIFCNDKKNVYYLMEKISIFYQSSLYGIFAKKAKKYLICRGLTEKIIKRFSIGFSSQGENNLVNFFCKNENDFLTLKKLGIIARNRYGNYYDRFYGRIIFPIRNIIGNVIAFGGRNLNGTSPKYLNSSENELFKKGKELYGLYEVTKSNVHLSKLLIVEGYMDVISLYQFKIDYAVSSLGTSTTKEQIKSLFKVTDTIICCYDGDIPGKMAAWRTLKITLPYLKDGLNLKFVFLPDGEDPDTLIRKEGKKEFEKRICLAENVSDFIFRGLFSKINISTYEGKIKFSSFIMSLIKLIPGDIFRVCLIQKLANFIGISDISYFLIVMNEKKVKKLNYNLYKNRLTNIQILIALLIQNPKFSSLVSNNSRIKFLKSSSLTFFFELVDFCKSNYGINTAQLLEYYRENNFIKNIKMLYTWSNIKSDNIAKEMFKDYLNFILKVDLNERFDFLMKKDRVIGLSNEEKKEVNMIAFNFVRN